MAAQAGECVQADVAISTAGGQTSIVNNSSKSITDYVLADPQQQAADGPRTYTGHFATNEFGPGKSVVFSADSSSGMVLIDFIRFADGSSCGNATTKEAKAVAARAQ